MDITLDITKNLKDQFDNYLDLNETATGFIPNPDIIEGQMRYLEFPGEVALYHFQKSQFRVPINMISRNPVDSEWYLIHINLSMVKQEKFVGDKKIEFQKYLPIGILVYGPELEIATPIPPNVDSELASFHFHRSFLLSYFENIEEEAQLRRSLIYEDLDENLERKLLDTLGAMDNKLECHGKALDFLNSFFAKIANHDKARLDGLHPDDISNLFKVATHLRNPLAVATGLDELAAMANMGMSKFKALFKQIFGKAPGEYRNKIRMEYAEKEINSGRTASEISHELGFSHPSNFSAAFKKYHGQLPSAAGN